MEHSNWETVIGLEIHAQLNTKSKIFSPAPNNFGDEPNTNISDVCTGQPGTLPVLNQEAVRKAVQFGCAIQADVAYFSKFDRKSYFYPDSPRNYQITQFDHPIVLGGMITTKVDGTTKQFKVNRAHLEDDAGMLKHFSTFGGVDYNRAGVPLIEIVSEPCLHSAKDAVAYATAIKSILEYIEASDCNMEMGSLRMDANISVKLKTETGLRQKIEIKNMNSFSNMEMAINAEIHRQIHLYTIHPDKPPEEVIRPGTYRFDLEKKETVLMRVKESADDYRYFPEPDLPPIILSKEYIEEVRRTLPELPGQRLERYIENLGLAESTALTLIYDKPLCEYFEESLSLCKKPKALANWILVEFVGRIKDSGKTLKDFGIQSKEIASLVNKIEDGTLNGKIAKSVADDMVANPTLTCDEIIKANPNYKPVNDTNAIEGLIDQVLAENAQSVTDYKEGKTKAFSYLIGQVMKLSKGAASPSLVNEILLKKLSQ
jgi:aspartyl-tRNA(Asn)/glutamyl-tRNA(Gln) amidotransferase subunit B